MITFAIGRRVARLKTTDARSQTRIDFKLDTGFYMQADASLSRMLWYVV